MFIALLVVSIDTTLVLFETITVIFIGIKLVGKSKDIDIQSYSDCDTFLDNNVGSYRKIVIRIILTVYTLTRLSALIIILQAFTKRMLSLYIKDSESNLETAMKIHRIASFVQTKLQSQVSSPAESTVELQNTNHYTTSSNNNSSNNNTSIGNNDSQSNNSSRKENDNEDEDENENDDDKEKNIENCGDGDDVAEEEEEEHDKKIKRTEQGCVPQHQI